MLSKQEIFDKAYWTIRLQGGGAFVTSGDNVVCKYLTEDGRKCAGGVFIGDDDYQECFEGINIEFVLHPASCPANRFVDFREALIKSGIDVTNFDIVRLLSRLQKLHDGVCQFSEGDIEFLHKWETDMQMLARCLNLQFSVNCPEWVMKDFMSNR